MITVETDDGKKDYSTTSLGNQTGFVRMEENGCWHC
jgi:hypothetical protein